MATHDLERTVERVLERQIPSLVHQIVVEQTYSGPLPPAEETGRYEQVLPGFTDRWVKMAEIEQRTRHETSRRRDWMNFCYSMGALLSASVLVLLFLGS